MTVAQLPSGSPTPTTSRTPGPAAPAPRSGAPISSGTPITSGGVGAPLRSTADPGSDRVRWLLGRHGALCLDLDGTLAEVATRRRRLWPELFRHPRLLAALPGCLRSLRGRRHADLDRALAAELARRTGARQDRAAAFAHRLLRTTWPLTFADAAPPAAVARLILVAVEAGLPLAVFSDHPAIGKLSAMAGGGSVSESAAAAPAPRSQPAVQELAWAVVDGHALGALKPLPDGLHAVAAQLGVAPSRLLFVGDREDTDGQAAAAAGATFLSVQALSQWVATGA